MRCTVCHGTEWLQDTGGIRCSCCQAYFSLQNGILDMLGDPSEETITPFQRLMQTPFVVSIYEKFWRRFGYYLASSRSFRQEMETVLELWQDRLHSPLLDLACGTGVFARPLAHHSDSLIVGLDLSRPMLRHARRLIHSSGLRNVRLIRGSAFELPFVDSALGGINCCGALHLFDRPDAALREIHRVLRPHGHLCVQTTIRPNRSAGFAFMLERFIRFGFFDESELRKKMNDQGFRLIESERHRISFTFLAERML